MKLKVSILLLLLTILINRSYSQEIKPSQDKVSSTLPSRYISSIYDHPYSLFDNQIDSNRLITNTLTMVGASVVSIGLLYLMPESFTNWDKNEMSASSVFGKWWKNVSHGPVVDHDDFFLNYVTHPYSGAVYYMGARSAGANATYSFIYSFMLSTFFWEYGIESLAEIPSVQDLIITPVIGSILGEGFYLAKRHIVSNDYRLLNSKILGHTTIFLIDPLNEVSNIFIKDPNKQKNLTISFLPYPSTLSGKSGYGIYFTLKG